MLVEPLPPPERLGHGVRRRARQHRHGEQPRADHADSEHEAREISGERTQRLRRIRAGGDLRLPAGVERECRRQDDEIHDQVREEHPEVDVDRRDPQLGPACAAARGSRLPSGRLLLLDLMARLPEEQVRRDRRPEDRDERRDVAALERDRRHDRRAERFAEWRADQDSSARVRYLKTRSIVL